MAENTTWPQIKEKINKEIEIRKLNSHYKERIDFEIAEIQKQGYESYWVNIYNSGKKFDSNKNHLVLPWLLDLIQDDPLVNRKLPLLNSVHYIKVKDYINKYGQMPPDFTKDQDMPDIDIDCLPEARAPIKAYAIEQYGNVDDNGYGAVCNVGTWQTYKFKSALIDAAKALGSDNVSGSHIEIEYDGIKVRVPHTSMVYELTTKLSETVDELKDNGISKCNGIILDSNTGDKKECGTKHAEIKCPQCGSTDTEFPTKGKLLSRDGGALSSDEYDKLLPFNDKFGDLINYAIRLIGRIRNMGMHAGALIIADRGLYGNIPMAKNGAQGHWISMWTEGRSPQLSKFGYTKWDILGLKTLEYLFNCCKLIKENRGISFGDNLEGWDDINPDDDKAGYYFDHNNIKHKITLNDPDALGLANLQKTDAVFQFDTDLAKCCAADSLIDCVDGLIPISELNNTKSIYFINNHNKLATTNNFIVKKSGIKKLKKIMFDDGRILRLTPEHRVYTTNGYKFVSELRINDEIVEIDDYR